MSSNPASILDSIKKSLGFESEYTAFDVDIIMHVNSVLVNLRQLDVGPVTGFAISDNTQLWTDLTPDIVMLAQIKSYVYIKVKLIFDTPATSFVIDALKEQAAEFEWRLNITAEAIEGYDDNNIHRRTTQDVRQNGYRYGGRFLSSS
jgi:hypothetical protein